MRFPRRLLALAVLPVLALAACGDPESTAPAESPGTTQPPVTTIDPDTPVTSPGGDATTIPPGAPDIGAALRRAASLLGAFETDLPEDVRIARRGDETFAVTTDLVPGRLTVELDDDGSGAFVVTSVTVETEDGSEVVTVATLLADAQEALGTLETGLDPAWRLGRRGDESFALTDDFVVGRFTVELDDDGTGVYVVSAVIVELPGGARTVTAP